MASDPTTTKKKPAAEPRPSGIGGDATPARADGRGGAATFSAFLVCSALGGLAAWWAVDRLGAPFGYPPEITPLLRKAQLSPEEQATFDAAVLGMTYRNTAVSLVAFGAAVGGLVGVAAGFAAGSARAIAVGLLSGLGLGAAFGALGGLADALAFDQAGAIAGRLGADRLNVTYRAIAMHASAFVIAGAGIGLAAGLVLRRVAGMTGASAAAGLIAGVLYPPLAATAFPLEADLPVPDASGALLMWTLLPAVLIGLACGRTASRRPRPGGRATA